MLMIQFLLAMVVFPALIALGLRVLSQGMQIRALQAQLEDKHFPSDGDDARAVLVQYAKLA